MNLLELDFLSERDTDTHRVCGACGQLKPVDAFYKDGKDNHGKTRYRRDCRECYKKTRLEEAKLKRRSKHIETCHRCGKPLGKVVVAMYGHLFCGKGCGVTWLVDATVVPNISEARKMYDGASEEVLLEDIT